jgi:hypothetical protein
VGNSVGDTLNELREAWERLALADPGGRACPLRRRPLVEIAAWCDARRKALHDLHDAHRQVSSLRLSKDAALAAAFPVAGLVEDLGRAAAAVAARTVLDAESALVAPKLGPLFRGGETDWSMLEAALDAASGLRDALTEGGRLPVPSDALAALRALTAPEGAARREELAVILQTLCEDRESLAPALAGLEALFRPEYLEKGGVGASGSPTPPSRPYRRGRPSVPARSSRSPAGPGSSAPATRPPRSA